MFKQLLNRLVGDTDALPLRVFEVLFTASFLVWLSHCFVNWRECLTSEGFHLNAAELNSLGYPLPFQPLSVTGVACLGVAVFLASVSLALNHYRRAALLVLFATAVYVQGVDLMSAFTLNKLYIGVYGILLVTSGYQKDTASGKLLVSHVPVRVIQATLILQYFAAGISKAFKGDWLLFSDVLHTQVQGVYRTDAAAWMLGVLPVQSWTMMQWASLLFELEAPVLFCVRKLRPLAFVIGLGFHFMISLLMKDLVFFSLQMWTFYVLFVKAETWRDLGTLPSRLMPSSLAWLLKPKPNIKRS